jgi:hypothetical protein
MKLKALRVLRFWTPIITAVGMIIIVGQEYVRPWVASSIYSEDYKKLVFYCDMAMHEEAALRQQKNKTAHEKALLLSADVGMLICHDYDKLRKVMLLHGVTEDKLAMLGLEILEHEQITVQQMVDAHRMDRF